MHRDLKPRRDWPTKPLRGWPTRPRCAPPSKAAYRQRFAFLMSGRPLVIEAVSVEAIGEGEALPADVAAETVEHRPTPLTTVRMHAEADDGQARWQEAGLYQREALQPGARIDGPAVIAERNATTVVEPGWQARLKPGRPAADKLRLGEDAPVGANAEAVLRRYEFFAFTGEYDPENHEALVVDDANPLPEELGHYLGCAKRRRQSERGARAGTAGAVADGVGARWPGDAEAPPRSLKRCI